MRKRITVRRQTRDMSLTALRHYFSGDGSHAKPLDLQRQRGSVTNILPVVCQLEHKEMEKNCRKNLHLGIGEFLPETNSGTSLQGDSSFSVYKKFEGNLIFDSFTWKAVNLNGLSWRIFPTSSSHLSGRKSSASSPQRSFSLPILYGR